MAENDVNGAAFTEVVDLVVNEAKFKQSLDAAEKLYTAFMARLGKDAKGALAASGVADVREEVKSFGDDMKVVMTDVASSVTQLSKNFEALLDRMDASRALRRNTAQAKRSAEEIAEFQVQALKKIERAADATREKFQRAQKQAREAALANLQGGGKDRFDKFSADLDTDFQRNANLDEDEAERKAAKLRTTLSRIGDEVLRLNRIQIGKDWIAQLEASERKVASLRRQLSELDKGGRFSNESSRANITDPEDLKAAEEYLSVLSKLRQADKDRARDEERAYAALEKIDAAQRKAAQSAENLADKRRSAFAAEQGKGLDEAYTRLLKQEESSKRARKLAEDINIEIEGAQNKFDDDQGRLQQKYNAELEKSVDLQNRLRIVEFGGNLKGRLTEINAQLEAANARIAKLNASGRFTGRSNADGLTAGEVDAFKSYNRELTRAKGLTAELNTVQTQLAHQVERTQKANQGFFDKVSSGFQGTFSHLVRYYIAFSAINTVLDVIRGTVTGVFDVIASGVKYTQDLERNISSLSGELAANVKFSDDLAENFKIAREAAKEVTELLQDRAIESGIGVESIESTFRALLEGGGQKGVANLRELVELSILFQKSLEAAGVGGLAAQGSIQEISKLFQGFPEPQNKFLAFLHLSSEEWVKIRTEGEKHRDLLPRVYERIRPYLSALEQAKNDQAVLVNRVTLLGQRLTAIAVDPLFGRLSSVARDLLEFLDNNRGKVIAFVRTISDGIELIIGQIQRLSEGTFLGDRLLNFMLGIQKVITAISAQMIAMSETADNFASTNFLTNPAEFAGKQLGTIQRWRQAVKELEESQSDIRRIFAGTILPSELGPDGQFGAPKESVLDRGFVPTPPPAPARPDIQNALAAFEEDKQKYLKGVEDIQEATRISKDRVEELASTQSISLAEAARRVSNIVDAEITAIRQLDAQLQAAIARTRGRIAVDKGTTDPTERQRSRDRFDAQIIALGREQQKREFNIAREKIAADKKAATEATAIAKDSYDQRLRVIRLAQDKERDLLQAGLAIGLFTQVEFFDRMEQLARDSANLRLEEMDAEISRLGEGTSAQEKLLNQREIAERDLAASIRVFGAQRQAVIEQETEAFQDYANKLREFDAQAGELFVRLSQQLRPEAGFGANVSELFDVRNRELDILESQKLKLLEVARAKNAESDQTRKLILDLRDLEGQRQRVFSERLQEISQGTSDVTTRNFFTRRAVVDEGLRLRDRQGEAIQRLNLFDAEKGGFITTPLGVNPKLAEEREQLVKELISINSALDKFKTQIENTIAPGFTRALTTLLDSIVGPGLIKRYRDAEGAQDKLAAATQIAANSLASISTIVSTFKQGKAQGGTLGGIGSVLGQFSGALSSIPAVGQFLPAIAGILTFVGGLFTASAKRIAENVKKSFQETMEAFQSGSITLIEAITTLERQRNDAIVRLSGTKGGKTELDKLLPELDRQLEDLRNRQKQILEDFDSSLNNLRLNSDVLSTISKKWQDINKQVRDYVGAGGDAAKAAEFLSLNLARIREDAADQLAQAEQEAIRDAIQLNDLLEQRVKLVKQFAQQEFDLVNADAIERRQAGSVTRGRQLQELREQRDAQLAALDAQLNLVNQRVEREREVFNLATELSSLRRRDEELTLLALDAQIARIRDLKSIVAGITLGPNGQFGVTPGAIPGFSVGEITVNVQAQPGVNPVDFGTQIGDSIGAELERRYRLTP